MRTTFLTAAVVILLSVSGLAQTSKPVNVLIITGDHGHNWKETTPFLKELLTKAGHKVDVTEQPKLDLDGIANAYLPVPSDRKVDASEQVLISTDTAPGAEPKVLVEQLGSRPLVDVPVGGAVEVQRSFRPEASRDSNKSNNNQSGFIVNVNARTKEQK